MTDNTRFFVDHATAYLAHPEPDNLAALQMTIVTAPTFRPDLSPLAAAAPLVERGDYDEVVETLLALMPGAFFSPSAHLLLAEAYRQLGDTSRAGREQSLARAAMRSILDSGDGSAERPWTVIRVSDEYDVLHSQRRTSQVQTLVAHGERTLDHHVCDDGSHVWFDITLDFTRDLPPPVDGAAVMPLLPPDLVDPAAYVRRVSRER